MKIPDTLTWEYDGFTGLLSSKEGDVISQTWDMDVKYSPDSDDNGEYIELACNMFPELVAALEGLISITEHVALKDYTPVDKAKELLNRIKT